MNTLSVIDSHTAGMPTRIIIDGGPNLGEGSLHDRLEQLRDQHDHVRTAAIKEPRGVSHLIGGLLCPPTDVSCSAGVIFFEGASYLGMCGHGLIGLMVTLQHLGRIDCGVHRIQTPIGVVQATLHDNGKVCFENVPSYRLADRVAVDVPDYGRVTGDIAWGGNWFFVVRQMPSTEHFNGNNVERLTEVTLAIRTALAQQGITGTENAPIHQVELFDRPPDGNCDSRNFVLCPGGYFDRSPCGTGTSAKLACLAADGDLKEGEIWRQQSITGSVFECSFRQGEDAQHIIPTICGQAFVTGEARLIINPKDPFSQGILCD